MKKHRLTAQTSDKIATTVLYIIAAFFVTLLILFVGHFIVAGWDELNWHFITSPPAFSTAGGIGPQLFNSVYLVLLADLISVPIGIAAGIYLAEYAPPNRMTQSIRFSIEALSSLPSIVIGMFGLLVFVTLTGWKYTSVRRRACGMHTTESAHYHQNNGRRAPLNFNRHEQSQPGAWRYALAVHRKVLLPAALPGLITGIILVSGRAFGEAAALLFTSGMSQPNLDFSKFFDITNAASPLNPFRPAETLADLHIQRELGRVGSGCAAGRGRRVGGSDYYFAYIQFRRKIPGKSAESKVRREKCG